MTSFGFDFMDRRGHCRPTECPAFLTVMALKLCLCPAAVLSYETTQSHVIQSGAGVQDVCVFVRHRDKRENMCLSCWMFSTYAACRKDSMFLACQSLLFHGVCA